MNEIAQWSDLFQHSVNTFFSKIIISLPRVLGAAVILLLGWLLAKLISKAIQRVLKALKFNKLAEKIKAQDFLERANIKSSPSQLIGRFAYWILILLVIIIAADTLGWTAISEEISRLIAYLPQLLAAVVFFIVGVYIATFVRDVITGATRTLGISAGKVISSFVFYLLLILVALTALEQAGIDTSIITSNLIIIIGSIMAAAAISYGFASRTVLSNILGSFFGRKTFRMGQKIEIDGQQGTIVAMTNVSVTIRLNEKEKLVVPARELIAKQIKILE
ncbi:MAG: mechanosensitive ion channel domain-containing protein [Bacteroidota bacterium]